MHPTGVQHLKQILITMGGMIVAEQLIHVIWGAETIALPLPTALRGVLGVDSADLLERPEPMLGALCAALGVPFTERMLWWPAGRRESDGIWARHWYHRVEQSTGFEAPPPPASGVAAMTPLPPAVAAIAARCRPLYERLRAHRLRA